MSPLDRGPAFATISAVSPGGPRLVAQAGMDHHVEGPSAGVVVREEGRGASDRGPAFYWNIGCHY